MTRTYAYYIHRKKQILVGRWPYATRNSDCLNISSNYPVAGTVGYQEEALDVLPDVQGSHAPPEADRGQHHSVPFNTMHPQPIEYVNGGNNSEHGHKLVQQLQQQVLSPGLSRMVGLSDGLDSSGCTMQHSNPAHQCATQSAAPMGLWSVTASHCFLTLKLSMPCKPIVV